MKQMWDKKKLEEMIEEGGSKITVDSELSNTSENPVQNKVINEAILGGLPDPLEQEGKVLGLDESGNLAWVEAGGKKLYIHTFSESGALGRITLICDKSTPFADTAEAASWFYNHGFTSRSTAYTCGTCVRKNISNVDTQLDTFVGIYSGGTTATSARIVLNQTTYDSANQQLHVSNTEVIMGNLIAASYIVTEL